MVRRLLEKPAAEYAGRTSPKPETRNGCSFSSKIRHSLGDGGREKARMGASQKSEFPISFPFNVREKSSQVKGTARVTALGPARAWSAIGPAPG
jgi:hypothetical protein